MDEIDLLRLTDHDFELVCKDIFEERLGKRLETFATGADGGVDLRYLSPDSGELVVVQCKHWARSGRSKLIRHMEEVEAEKVRKLAPSRYLIATSVDLTPDSKTKLVRSLQPYVLSPADILGAGELVAELRNHPEIVRRHLRLWLSSSAVLQSILAKPMHERAGLLEDAIQQTLSVYAPTPALEEASEILERHHAVVIAGSPGIGKTTLGHVLVAAYVQQGYELFEIANDVDEALQVWSDDVPQVFYYDDFLGQTSLRDTVPTNEDSRLTQLIQKVSVSPNKRLVMTTREYILAQARQQSEKLDRSQELKMACFVLDITRYQAMARAGILYNHLYFSGLSFSHLAVFADPVVYEPIIAHRNFNPRLLATSVRNVKTEDVTPEDFVAHLMRNLDSPDDIWGHMFDNQMSAGEVALVLIVYTFRKPLDLETLIEIWGETTASRPHESSRSVTNILRVLEGTLIRVLAGGQHESSSRVAIHNPSIRDFLRERLSRDPSLVRGMLSNGCQFEQIAALFSIATGYRGAGLMKILFRNRAVVEARVLEVLPSELEDLDESRWFSALGEAIPIAVAIESEPIFDICRRWLSGTWPEFVADPLDAIVLVKALRVAPNESGLQSLEEPITTWLIDQIMDNTSSWEDLRSAEYHLLELGGPEAQSAVDVLNDRMVGEAEEAAERLATSGMTPTLSEAQEMLDTLSDFPDARFNFTGYSKLEKFVHDGLERQREMSPQTPVVHGLVDAQSAASIASMMAHLRDRSPNSM